MQGPDYNGAVQLLNGIITQLNKDGGLTGSLSRQALAALLTVQAAVQAYGQGQGQQDKLYEAFIKLTDIAVKCSSKGQVSNSTRLLYCCCCCCCLLLLLLLHNLCDDVQFPTADALAAEDHHLLQVSCLSCGSCTAHLLNSEMHACIHTAPVHFKCPSASCGDWSTSCALALLTCRIRPVQSRYSQAASGCVMQSPCCSVL